MSVRGMRNNNPGNIERNGTKWAGMSENQDDPRFVVFRSMEWGCRALIKILITYRKRHGLKTIRQIINRFAPSNENNTEGYVRRVCRDTGFGADEVIDDSRESFIMLAKAIANVEVTASQAEKITNDIWDRASEMAGL